VSHWISESNFFPQFSHLQWRLGHFNVFNPFRYFLLVWKVFS
jgi:hypothetical protein